MPISPDIFKAYDVRGIYPGELGEATARRIGEAYAAVRAPKKVAVGRDVRLSSPELEEALIGGLTASGVDVVRIGVITTDQLYYAVAHFGYDGGITVSASHNPAQYNGFKFAERGGGPVSSEDLLAFRDWALSDAEPSPTAPGTVGEEEILEGYLDHVLSFVDTSRLRSFRLVANANFGAVGRGMDRIGERLSLSIERLNWSPDGSFPKGPPNPLLEGNRVETAALVAKERPDLGVSWDADADRCFFFDETGEFIPGCFVTALLSQLYLSRYPGAKIVYDASFIWAVRETVEEAGGTPVEERVGHTFMKARMRAEDSPFGGEDSGHYYFRDNFYADNGLIPLLLVLELMSDSGRPLSELIRPFRERYFVSGERNFTVSDAAAVISRLRDHYRDGEPDPTDGLGVSYLSWRFNVRASNTEPLLRLSVESRTSEAEAAEKLGELTALIEAAP